MRKERKQAMAAADFKSKTNFLFLITDYTYILTYCNKL